MLVREFNADRLHVVLDDPAVLPGAGFPEHACVAEHVLDWRNVLLMLTEGEGGVVFTYRTDGIYNVSVQFRESVRGAAAFQAVAEALEWMFLRTPCMELWVQIAANNEAARMMMVNRNFRSEFSAGEFQKQKLEHFALRFDTWLWQGQHTGSALEPAKRAAWATKNMIGFGQVSKGIILYNRFALRTNTSTITVVNEVPLVFELAGTKYIADNGEVQTIT